MSKDLTILYFSPIDWNFIKQRLKRIALLLDGINMRISLAG